MGSKPSVLGFDFLNIKLNICRVFVLMGIILVSVFSNNAAALQQSAGHVIFELQPGGTKTLQWGLVSDSDVPITLALRVEGKGSELVSFPKTVTIEPRQRVDVDLIVTIPNNYQNDVLLTPAIYATQSGEAGGAAVINIAMKKILTIKIGNPIETDTVPANPSDLKSKEQAALDQKEVKPTPLTIKTDDVDPEPTSESPKMTSAESQAKKSGGCLIATAAYGSEMATQVQLLREVRDNVLLGTSSGTGFMAAFNTFYYSFSPTVADWERQNPVFKEAVKMTLTPMLSTLSILNYVDIHSDTEMLGYGIGIILLNAGMYFVAPAVVIVYAKRKLACRF